mgnify:CR=1 FL=1
MLRERGAHLSLGVELRRPRNARLRRNFDCGDLRAEALFFAFALAFLIIPTFYLVNGSFHTEKGAFTLQNYADLSDPTIIGAFQASIEISLVTAIIGGIFGFLLLVMMVLRPEGLIPSRRRRIELHAGDDATVYAYRATNETARFMAFTAR